LKPRTRSEKFSRTAVPGIALAARLGAAARERLAGV
jgi:hypothetical protein